MAVTDLDDEFACVDVQKADNPSDPVCECAGSCTDTNHMTLQTDFDACEAVNTHGDLTDGTDCRAVIKAHSLPTCVEAAPAAESSGSVVCVITWYKHIVLYVSVYNLVNS